MSKRIEIRKTREEWKRQKLDVERERIAYDNKCMRWSRRDLNLTEGIAKRQRLFSKRW